MRPQPCPPSVLLSLALAAVTAAVGCGSTGEQPVGGSGTTSATASGGSGGSGGATGTTSSDTTSTTSSSSTTSSATGTGGAQGGVCPAAPKCDAAPPDPGPAQPWRHDIMTPIVTAAGAPNHRGRDLYLNPGDPQWIIGKFAYGLIDKDLKDEDVDVWLLRDCGATWELLGTATTTEESAHATVEGVDDNGGRVYFQIPAQKALGPGRHRAHLVVKGDLSSTDVFLEVVPKGTPMFVSDVDGTLTDSENAEFGALLTGALPAVHPDAAKAFRLLVEKGYRPMYLTARPEWLVPRTRQTLDVNGFPPGIVHTTLGLTGATGAPAATFKTDELALLAGKGLVPAWAFGNTATDAEAYENAGIMPVDQRVFYQFDDAVYGGRRIESYTELLAEIAALPSLCQ